MLNVVDFFFSKWEGGQRNGNTALTQTTALATVSAPGLLQGLT